MGPMGLQCDKLQRDDLDRYRQPLQERRRGHGKTRNVPTTNRFKEERAHNSWHYALSVWLGFVFQQQEMRKLAALRGVWPMDTPCKCRV